MVVLSLLTSGVVVKQYEKGNLNDPDMVLVDKKADRNIATADSYREAAFNQMTAKPEAVVVAIKQLKKRKLKNISLITFAMLIIQFVIGQTQDSTQVYKKSVL